MTAVRLLVLAAGLLVVAVVLWEVFEAVVLPRRVARRLRLVVVIMPKAAAALAHLRHLYEPYVTALSFLLLMPLPTWIPPPEARDNWERSPWR